MSVVSSSNHNPGVFSSDSSASSMKAATDGSVAKVSHSWDAKSLKADIKKRLDSGTLSAQNIGGLKQVEITDIVNKHYSADNGGKWYAILGKANNVLFVGDEEAFDSDEYKNMTGDAKEKFFDPKRKVTEFRLSRQFDGGVEYLTAEVGFSTGDRLLFSPGGATHSIAGVPGSARSVVAFKAGGSQKAVAAYQNVKSQNLDSNKPNPTENLRFVGLYGVGRAYLDVTLASGTTVSVELDISMLPHFDLSRVVGVALNLESPDGFTNKAQALRFIGGPGQQDTFVVIEELGQSVDYHGIEYKKDTEIEVFAANYYRGGARAAGPIPDDRIETQVFTVEAGQVEKQEKKSTEAGVTDAGDENSALRLPVVAKRILSPEKSRLFDRPLPDSVKTTDRTSYFTTNFFSYYSASYAKSAVEMLFKASNLDQSGYGLEMYTILSYMGQRYSNWTNPIRNKDDEEKIFQYWIESGFATAYVMTGVIQLSLEMSATYKGAHAELLAAAATSREGESLILYIESITDDQIQSALIKNGHATTYLTDMQFKVSIAHVKSELKKSADLISNIDVEESGLHQILTGDSNGVLEAAERNRVEAEGKYNNFNNLHDQTINEHVRNMELLNDELDLLIRNNDRSSKIEIWKSASKYYNDRIANLRYNTTLDDLDGFIELIYRTNDDKLIKIAEEYRATSSSNSRNIIATKYELGVQLRRARFLEENAISRSKLAGYLRDKFDLTGNNIQLQEVKGTYGRLPLTLKAEVRDIALNYFAVGESHRLFIEQVAQSQYSSYAGVIESGVFMMWWGQFVVKHALTVSKHREEGTMTLFNLTMAQYVIATAQMGVGVAARMTTFVNITNKLQEAKVLDPKVMDIASRVKEINKTFSENDIASFANKARVFARVLSIAVAAIAVILVFHNTRSDGYESGQEKAAQRLAIANVGVAIAIGATTVAALNSGASLVGSSVGAGIAGFQILGAVLRTVAAVLAADLKTKYDKVWDAINSAATDVEKMIIRSQLHQLDAARDVMITMSIINLALATAAAILSATGVLAPIALFVSIGSMLLNMFAGDKMAGFGERLGGGAKGTFGAVSLIGVGGAGIPLAYGGVTPAITIPMLPIPIPIVTIVVLILIFTSKDLKDVLNEKMREQFEADMAAKGFHNPNDPVDVMGFYAELQKEYYKDTEDNYLNSEDTNRYLLSKNAEYQAVVHGFYTRSSENILLHQAMNEVAHLTVENGKFRYYVSYKDEFGNFKHELAFVATIGDGKKVSLESAIAKVLENRAVIEANVLKAIQNELAQREGSARFSEALVVEAVDGVELDVVVEHRFQSKEKRNKLISALTKNPDMQFLFGASDMPLINQDQATGANAYFKAHYFDAVSTSGMVGVPLRKKDAKVSAPEYFADFSAIEKDDITINMNGSVPLLQNMSREDLLKYVEESNKSIGEEDSTLRFKKYSPNRYTYPDDVYDKFDNKYIYAIPKIKGGKSNLKYIASNTGAHVEAGEGKGEAIYSAQDNAVNIVVNNNETKVTRVADEKLDIKAQKISEYVTADSNDQTATVGGASKLEIQDVSYTRLRRTDVSLTEVGHGESNETTGQDLLEDKLINIDRITGTDKNDTAKGQAFSASGQLADRISGKKPGAQSGVPELERLMLAGGDDTSTVQARYIDGGDGHDEATLTPETIKYYQSLFAKQKEGRGDGVPFGVQSVETLKVVASDTENLDQLVSDITHLIQEGVIQGAKKIEIRKKTNFNNSDPDIAITVFTAKRKVTVDVKKTQLSAGSQQIALLVGDPKYRNIGRVFSLDSDLLDAALSNNDANVKIMTSHIPEAPVAIALPSASDTSKRAHIASQVSSLIDNAVIVQDGTAHVYSTVKFNDSMFMHVLEGKHTLALYDALEYEQEIFYVKVMPGEQKVEGAGANPINMIRVDYREPENVQDKFVGLERKVELTFDKDLEGKISSSVTIGDTSERNALMNSEKINKLLPIKPLGSARNFTATSHHSAHFFGGRGHNNFTGSEGGDNYTISTGALSNTINEKSDSQGEANQSAVIDQVFIFNDALDGQSNFQTPAGIERVIIQKGRVGQVTANDSGMEVANLSIYGARIKDGKGDDKINGSTIGADTLVSQQGGSDLLVGRGGGDTYEIHSAGRTGDTVHVHEFDPEAGDKIVLYRAGTIEPLEITSFEYMISQPNTSTILEVEVEANGQHKGRRVYQFSVDGLSVIVRPKGQEEVVTTVVKEGQEYRLESKETYAQTHIYFDSSEAEYAGITPPTEISVDKLTPVEGSIKGAGNVFVHRMPRRTSEVSLAAPEKKSASAPTPGETVENNGASEPDSSVMVAPTRSSEQKSTASLERIYLYNPPGSSEDNRDYSSTYNDESTGYSDGELKTGNGSAWVANSLQHDASPWAELTVPENQRVVSVVTAGRNIEYDHWVSKYTVKYQMKDSSEWIEYGEGQVFDGNTNKTDLKINGLFLPDNVDKIRVYPKEFRANPASSKAVYYSISGETVNQGDNGWNKFPAMSVGLELTRNRSPQSAEINGNDAVAQKNKVMLHMSPLPAGSVQSILSISIDQESGTKAPDGPVIEDLKTGELLGFFKVTIAPMTIGDKSVDRYTYDYLVGGLREKSDILGRYMLKWQGKAAIIEGDEVVKTGDRAPRFLARVLIGIGETPNSFATPGSEMPVKLKELSEADVLNWEREASDYISSRSGKIFEIINKYHTSSHMNINQRHELQGYISDIKRYITAVEWLEKFGWGKEKLKEVYGQLKSYFKAINFTIERLLQGNRLSEGVYNNETLLSQAILLNQKAELLKQFWYEYDQARIPSVTKAVALSPGLPNTEENGSALELNGQKSAALFVDKPEPYLIPKGQDQRAYLVVSRKDNGEAGYFDMKVQLSSASKIQAADLSRLGKQESEVFDGKMSIFDKLGEAPPPVVHNGLYIFDVTRLLQDSLFLGVEKPVLVLSRDEGKDPVVLYGTGAKDSPRLIYATPTPVESEIERSPGLEQMLKLAGAKEANMGDRENVEQLNQKLYLQSFAVHNSTGRAANAVTIKSSLRLRAYKKIIEIENATKNESAEKERSERVKLLAIYLGEEAATRPGWNTSQNYYTQDKLEYFVDLSIGAVGEKRVKTEEGRKELIKRFFDGHIGVYKTFNTTVVASHIASANADEYVLGDDAGDREYFETSSQYLAASKWDNPTFVEQRPKNNKFELNPDGTKKYENGIAKTVQAEYGAVNKIWVPENNKARDGSEYVDISIPQGYRATKIKTAGGGGSDDYVKKYRLKWFSDISGKWHDVNSGEEFNGNTNHIDTVENKFEVPAGATKIRIIPTEFKDAIALKVGLTIKKIVDNPVRLLLKSTMSMAGNYSEETRDPIKFSVNDKSTHTNEMVFVVLQPKSEEKYIPTIELKNKSTSKKILARYTTLHETVKIGGKEYFAIRYLFNINAFEDEPSESDEFELVSKKPVLFANSLEDVEVHSGWATVMVGNDLAEDPAGGIEKKDKKTIESLAPGLLSVKHEDVPDSSIFSSPSPVQKNEGATVAIQSGLQNEEVYNPPDHERLYSSAWDQFDTNPRSVKGMDDRSSKLDSNGAWSPKYNDKYQWLQVPLPKDKKVVEVLVQRRFADPQRFVNKFIAEVELSDGTWVELNNGIAYGEAPDSMFLYDNQSGNSTRFPVKFAINAPMGARSIRIRPMEWNEDISMRVGFTVEDSSGNRVAYNPPEEERSYSSVKGKRTYALNEPFVSSDWNSTDGWVAAGGDGEWLQLKIPPGKKVVGISTKGRGEHNQYVKNYTIKYMDLSGNWQYVKGFSGIYGKRFTGNSHDDKDQGKKNTVDIPAGALALRIYPTEWNEKPAMRVKLHVKDHVYEGYSISSVYEPRTDFALGVRAVPGAENLRKYVKDSFFQPLITLEKSDVDRTRKLSHITEGAPTPHYYLDFGALDGVLTVHKENSKTLVAITVEGTDWDSTDFSLTRTNTYHGAAEIDGRDFVSNNFGFRTRPHKVLVKDGRTVLLFRISPLMRGKDSAPGFVLINQSDRDAKVHTLNSTDSNLRPKLYVLEKEAVKTAQVSPVSKAHLGTDDNDKLPAGVEYSTGRPAKAIYLFGGNDTVDLSTKTPVASTTKTSVAPKADPEPWVINGGDGSDTLTGGALLDKIEGGSGDDTLKSFARNDELIGGAGDDSLVSQSTKSSSSASSSVDTLRGGTGIDTFVVKVGTDREEDSLAYIQDFEPGEDTLKIEESGGSTFKYTELAELKTAGFQQVLLVQQSPDGSAKRWPVYEKVMSNGLTVRVRVMGTQVQNVPAAPIENPEQWVVLNPAGDQWENPSVARLVSSHNTLGEKLDLSPNGPRESINVKDANGLLVSYEKVGTLGSKEVIRLAVSKEPLSVIEESSANDDAQGGRETTASQMIQTRFGAMSRDQENADVFFTKWGVYDSFIKSSEGKLKDDFKVAEVIYDPNIEGFGPGWLVTVVHNNGEWARSIIFTASGATKEHYDSERLVAEYRDRVSKQQGAMADQPKASTAVVYSTESSKQIKTDMGDVPRVLSATDELLIREYWSRHKFTEDAAKFEEFESSLSAGWLVFPARYNAAARGWVFKLSSSGTPDVTFVLYRNGSIRKKEGEKSMWTIATVSSVLSPVAAPSTQANTQAVPVISKPVKAPPSQADTDADKSYRVQSGYVNTSVGRIPETATSTHLRKWFVGEGRAKGEAYLNHFLAKSAEFNPQLNGIGGWSFDSGPWGVFHFLANGQVKQGNTQLQPAIDGPMDGSNTTAQSTEQAATLSDNATPIQNKESEKENQDHYDKVNAQKSKPLKVEPQPALDHRRANQTEVKPADKQFTPAGPVAVNGIVNTVRFGEIPETLSGEEIVQNLQNNWAEGNSAWGHFFEYQADTQGAGKAVYNANLEGVGGWVLKTQHIELHFLVNGEVRNAGGSAGSNYVIPKENGMPLPYEERERELKERSTDFPGARLGSRWWFLDESGQKRESKVATNLLEKISDSGDKMRFESRESEGGRDRWILPHPVLKELEFHFLENGQVLLYNAKRPNSDIVFYESFAKSKTAEAV